MKPLGPRQPLRGTRYPGHAKQAPKPAPLKKLSAPPPAKATRNLAPKPKTPHH